MKVIQIIPELDVAGAEIMCENLTYELVKKNNEVIVISLYDKYTPITERLEEQGIRIIYLSKKSGLDLSIIKKLINIFKKEKPDVIHTHRYVMVYAIPAAIFTGIKKRVHTLHSVADKENDKLGRIFSKFFYKHCNVIPVALSELVRDTVECEYHIEKCNIPIIYNGINIDKCFKKLNYDLHNPINIVHVGRFFAVKNHKGLVEAFNIVHDKYPNSILTLVGDGEEKPEIEKLVFDMGLDSCVRFLGLQNDVTGILAEADIFTLVSTYEGIPLSLAEAMGSALPIVATNVGGIPDMIKNNYSGLLVDIDNESIAEALIKYVDDDSLRKITGTNAVQSVFKFSAEEMARNYIKLYEEEFF